MCQALKCQPGDVLALALAKKNGKKGAVRERARKKQR
jgi:hypothetical protein